MEGQLGCWATVAALALGTVIGGCGDASGDRGSGADRPASSATVVDGDPAVQGGDEAQIGEVVDDIQDALAAGDGGLCFELSKGQVRRLATWAGRPATADCFGIVGAVAKRRRSLGIESVRSRVLSVEVAGGYGESARATAVVEDSGGGSYRVRFTKQGGDWKTVRFRPETSSGLGEPEGGAGASHEPGRDVAGPEVEPALRSSLPPGGRLLVRGVDAVVPRADGALFETGGDAARQVGDVSCKRVDRSRSGVGLCLTVAQAGDAYEGVVLDTRYRPVRRFDADGIPDRVRVSADGRYGAYTSFDQASSQGYFTSTGDFKTYTRIHDMRTGRELLRLEDLRIDRDGRLLPQADAELWGVSFAGGDRYYATFAPPGHHYLIAGRVGERRARVVRDRVECPALSPDGRRIAYKRRLGSRNAWRFHVLDLGSGHDVALAETRSVDDQPAWLGDDSVVYSDDRAVFAVPADGRGKPARIVRHATSPAYVGP